jgi:hypothetical protein
MDGRMMRRARGLAMELDTGVLLEYTILFVNTTVGF